MGEHPDAARIGLLGPTLAVVAGIERDITAPRQRAVLARLAVDVGEPVSADRLLTDIWGDDLPAGRARAVAFQISKLRSALEPDREGEGELIGTTPAGYVLRLAPDAVDIHHFERLVGESRRTLTDDPELTRRIGMEALQLWRGRPFADVADAPFVDDVIQRLDQRRLLAEHTVIKARMGAGEHEDVIADLEQLIRENPHEESLVKSLMSALHHSNRTADGLRAYADLRFRLGKELGIEPSGDLQAMERALLTAEADPGEVGEHSTRRRRPLGVPSAILSCVGRDADIAELGEMLLSARLVTLCGFGGLGKTRLAQEVAREVAGRFPEGVWFVDLTPVTEADVLADTFLTAAGEDSAADVDPFDHLLEVLSPREALLFVDNCEHVVDDVAGLVQQILQTAPGIRALATSRQSLGVAGEAVFTVRPLGSASTLELFVDRARLVRPGFRVDEKNQADVDRICRYLDGIPLAVEMAAARLAVMSVEMFSELIDDRFRLLTRTGRSVDQRQSSLSVVMDWSYDLLDEADRSLLRRLVVCVGGFDIEAAVAIGAPDSPLDRSGAVLDQLARVVEASLVVFGEDQVGTPRYRILEPVRRHLLEKLGPEELTEASHAHASHYRAVARHLAELGGRDHLAMRRLGDRELGNLRAAVGWAYANEQPRLGLSISNGLHDYLLSRLMLREALSLIRPGVEAIDDRSADVLEGAGWMTSLAFLVGDLETRRSAAARVRTGLDSVDDVEQKGRLLRVLGIDSLDTDPRAAQAHFLAALECYRSATGVAMEPSIANARRGLGALNNAVETSWTTGTIDASVPVAERLDELTSALPATHPLTIKIRAFIAGRAGRWEEVLQIAAEAKDLDENCEVSVRLLEAEALGASGDHERALTVLDGLQVPPSGDDMRDVEAVRASIHLARGEPGVAARVLVSMAEEIGKQPLRLAYGSYVASLMAIAAHDLGQEEAAATLFGYAAAEQERLDLALRLSDRPLEERAIQECRRNLGDSGFAELSALGAGTDWSDLPLPRVGG